MSNPATERITVGLVRGLHGLDGGVRVEVLSDESERFAVGSVLFIDGEEHPLTIAWAQPSKPGLLVRFEGIVSREQAEGFRERYLEAAIGEPLPAGSWYWHQVMGLKVTSTEGEALGSVTDVFRAGGREVYVVRGGARGEILVPAIGDVVTELDPDAGRLIVDAGVLALDDIPPRRRRRRHERAGGPKRPANPSRTARGEGSAEPEGSADRKDATDSS